MLASVCTTVASHKLNDLKLCSELCCYCPAFEAFAVLTVEAQSAGEGAVSGVSVFGHRLHKHRQRPLTGPHSIQPYRLANGIDVETSVGGDVTVSGTGTTSSSRAGSTTLLAVSQAGNGSVTVNHQGVITNTGAINVTNTNGVLLTNTIAGIKQ